MADKAFEALWDATAETAQPEIDFKAAVRDLAEESKRLLRLTAHRFDCEIGPGCDCGHDAEVGNAKAVLRRHAAAIAAAKEDR